MDVFFANLNSQNKDRSLLIKYLEKSRPSIVFLVEVNESWANELKKLKLIYPYSKAIVREGNFGMAVLSQNLLEVENVFIDRVNRIPALFLKTKNSIGVFNLVLLHAYPPIGEYATMVRDQYLDSMSHRISVLSSPLLVCGDFNITPWTSIYQKFLNNSDLEIDKSHMTPNTWPVTSLLPSLPIDHCLARGLKILNYEKGLDIGSDHWPLSLKISIDYRTMASEKK